MLWLLIVIAALVLVAAFLIRTRYWELGPCPRCQRRRGKGWLSSDRAFNHNCRCGGRGERIRPMSLIWAKHRAEARRRRDAVKRAREKR